MGAFFPTTCLRAQESSTWRTGRSFLPKGVGAYSTRTGISANILLTTSPSLASSRNCCVSTFCEIRGILPRRSLNRRGSSLFRSHQRITGFHRPPISAISSSIGQKLAIRLALIFPPVLWKPGFCLVPGIQIIVQQQTLHFDPGRKTGNAARNAYTY